MNNVPVITIDGPTASGKGTIAQRVADALRFNYLDSGALYRLVAWRALQDAVSADDADQLSAVAAAIAPRFAGGRISMDGQDVTDCNSQRRSQPVRVADCCIQWGQKRIAQTATIATPAAGPRGGRARHGYRCFS